MGKGDTPRPVDRDKWEASWKRIEDQKKSSYSDMPYELEMNLIVHGPKRCGTLYN